MQGEKVPGSKRTNEMSVGMNEVHSPRKKGGSTICTAGSVRESRGTRQSAVGPTERAMRQQLQIAKFHWEIADGIANPLPKQGWFRRHFFFFSLATSVSLPISGGLSIRASRWPAR
ncbi:hypothetical protein QG37_04595 [Candidozyma auris]|nr:hypothetical protein QG37_04595 [[Candida] auris]